MKHAASRELYAYWEEKRGTRRAPERTEIEPGAIRGVLSDAFILALDRSAGHPSASPERAFAPCSAARSKASRSSISGCSTSRPTMEGLLSILSDECTGTVAGATGQNENGESVELELLLLPLSIRRPSSPAPSACWRRLKSRRGWEQAPSGR